MQLRMGLKRVLFKQKEQEREVISRMDDAADWCALGSQVGEGGLGEA